MSKPVAVSLNSFVAKVQWTPPVDTCGYRRRPKPPALRYNGVRLSINKAILPPELPDPDMPVQGYRLRFLVLREEDMEPTSEYMEDAQGEWGADATHAILNSLVPGLGYIFEVAAFNRYGQGPWSDPSERFLMPKRDLFGMQPTSTAAERAALLPALCSPRPNSIALHINAPCHRGSNIMAYDIQCSQDPEFCHQVKEFRLPGDATSMDVDGLEPNTVYYFKYRAWNSVGSSDWTPRTPGVVTTAKPPQQPAAPKEIEVVGERPSFELRIEWVPPHSYDLPIRSYHVRMSTSPNMELPFDVQFLPPRHPLFSQLARPGGDEDAGEIQSVSAEDGEARDDKMLCGLPINPSSPLSAQLRLLGPSPVVTQLRITKLEPCTHYYFQVKATNQIGESAWSDPSAPMTTGSAVPSRCGKPSFVANTRGEGITFSFQAPDTYGVPGGIKRYDVRVAKTAGMQEAIEIGDVTTTMKLRQSPRDHHSLQVCVRSSWDPHINHFYQVRGMSSAGTGAWSEPSDAMRVAAEEPLRPDAPYDFTVLPRAFVVHWTTSDCRGSPITHYRLRYSTASDMQKAVEVQGMALKGLATQCAVTAIQAHHTYYFQVAAVNAEGCSDWSAVSRPVAAMQAPPQKMGSPVLLNATANSLFIGFVGPADLGTLDGELLRSYTVRYADGAGGLEKLSADQSGGAQHPDVRTIRNAKPDGVEIKGLLPGRPCFAQVHAHNDWGEGPPSDVGVFYTVCAAPSAPFPPEKADQTSYSITLCLRPTTDNGSPITLYKLEGEAVDLQEKWETETFENCSFSEETLQHYCVTRLKAGHRYRFRVMAFNAKGQSAWSEQSVDLFTQPIPPEAVTGLTVTNVSHSSLRLSWIPGHDNGDRITEFIVQWSADSSFHKCVHELRCAETETMLTDCLPGAICYARVAAVNGEGAGIFSSVSEALMLGHVPQRPAPPKPFEAGPNYCKIGWTYPHDSGSKIIDCIIKYEETETDGRTEDERDMGEFEVGGKKRAAFMMPMCAGREYIYFVLCINSYGYGDFSPPSIPMRIAPAEVPSPPGQPQFVSATDASLIMQWTSAEPNGADIIDQLAQLCVDPLFPAEKVIEVVLPPCPSILDPLSVTRGTRRSITEEAQKREAARQVVTSFEMGGLLEGTCYYVRVLARNHVGRSAFSVASEKNATLANLPDPIPEDPGLVPLEDGCTTLSFGWQRPFCHGSPIKHYLVRCAESLEGLEDLASCVQHEIEEEKPAVWEGMASKPRELSKVEQASLDTKQNIIIFVQYILSRFGALQESWEWLDVNGNGTLCKDEFLEGDLDTGPPFADFDRPEVLPEVWRLLDNDDSGEISVNEYNKLLPYMEAIREGLAGMRYDGVRVMLPNLMPGKEYYVKAQAVNEVGCSPWTHCISGARRTSSMTPGIGDPIGGVPELRRKDAVTLRWTLPPDNGEPLTRMELRYRSWDLEEGPMDRSMLRENPVQIELNPDASTGVIPTEHLVDGLLPGQCVFASIRAFNSKGGSRLWSALAGRESTDVRVGFTGAGLPERIVEWECCSLPSVPDKPRPAAFIEDSLVSVEFKSSGQFEFMSERTNGLPFIAVTYRIHDEALALVQEHQTESRGPDDGEIQFVSLRRSVMDLKPGELYSLQVRLHNDEGASEWSEMGPQMRMPPDRPNMPRAMLCENRSLEWIELKWFPPHHNGAHIQGYDIMMTDEGMDAPEEAWWHVDEAFLKNRTREYGADGRKVPERDTGAMLLKVQELKPACTYTFMVRAWNAIGWSPWSDTTPIMTKAVRPNQTPLRHEFAGVLGTVCKMEWGLPDANGTPLLRFDVIFGPSKRRIQWLAFMTRLLSLTVDLDGLFSKGNEDAAAEVIEDGATGTVCRDQLTTEELWCESLPPHQTTHAIGDLLNGQSYYYMVRGVNSAGKGDFSDIAGPFSISPGKLPSILAPEFLKVGEKSCEVLMKLPYDMGAPIMFIDLTVTRNAGPLAAHDIDGDTGECHPHIARRTICVSPQTLEKRLPPAQPGYEHRPWEPGTTDAVTRAAGCQDVDVKVLVSAKHQPTLTDCTGVTYVVCLQDLMPGTRYEVRWSCRSIMGPSPEAASLFQTLAARPDIPGHLNISGL